MIADISFRIYGERIPLDHGYALYSSLARFNPSWHESEWLGIHPINGLAVKDAVRLTRFSRLRVRAPIDRLPELIRLAGKRLRLQGRARHDEILIGVPEVLPLRSSSSLRSRCVTIKVSEVEKTKREPDRDMFLTAARKQLAAHNIKGELWIDDARDTQGRERSRRVLHIKDQTIVGYAVTISNLNEEDSLKLQIEGLGGRRRLGCGLFVPFRKREAR